MSRCGAYHLRTTLLPHADHALRAPQEGVELRSQLAAAKGLPIKVKVREHQYCLAFALTDFKLQGRTLRKLILSLSDRKKPPWVTICAFYVFISRVRRAASLRLLKRDDEQESRRDIYYGHGCGWTLYQICAS